MQTEKEYIVNIFNENFSKYKDKRIILYGTGPNTKLILENVNGFNFVGLMDGYKKCGSMYGLDILDYDDVVKKNIDIIIIVARASSRKIIYNRISDFCNANGFLTLDIYGNDLAKNKEHFTENNLYFENSEEDLKKQIDSHEVISFDVFDTLIMRKTLFPEDVFEIIGNKISNNEFTKLRMSCTNFKRNANIFEVYDEYQKLTNISDEEKNRLIELELEIEKSVLVAREKMVEIFNYAIDKGKDVYLISDMYLPKNILNEILSKLNITGYKSLFVSCDYRMLKSQGLYGVYKESVQALSYLHIGDNEEADGIYAKVAGLDSYLIKSAYEMLEISIYRDIIDDAKTISERCILGLFIEKAFNNPFSLYKSKGRLKVEKPYNRGYLFIAPVIASFMEWFIDNVREYDSVIFSARDGYLLSKLYEIADRDNKLPRASYVLTSRVAAVASALYDKEDIEYASGYSFGGSPEDMLEKRFFLKKEEILEYTGEGFDEYALKHYDKILSRAKELRNNYLKYLEEFELSGKVAFFDFVASGTCQMCLNRILNINSQGFYFIRMLVDYYKIRGLNISAFLESANVYKLKSNIYEDYLFLEYIITSFEPSLSHFDEKGKPIFLEETRTPEYIEYVKEVHEGIINYYKEFINLISNSDINITLVDKLFGYMQERFSDIDDKIPSNVVLNDEFCNCVIDIKGMK